MSDTGDTELDKQRELEAERAFHDTPASTDGELRQQVRDILIFHTGWPTDAQIDNEINDWLSLIDSATRTAVNGERERIMAGLPDNHIGSRGYQQALDDVRAVVAAGGQA